MKLFAVGDRCWTFFTYLSGKCTLDAFSLKTFWIEPWEILNIKEGDRHNRALKIFTLKNIREWVNPRDVLSDCCYQSKEAAIGAMRRKLKEFEE
ncbi:MAG TPA: hypothetical protein ACFYDZ_00275 [Candidatus Brocadiaceae bacterium]